MTKYTALVGLFAALSLISACSERERIPPIDWPDSGIGYADSGPACDPADERRLLSDFNNCGACGVRCNADGNNADSCLNGFCRCGDGPACGEGADCIAGRCLMADRFTECMTADDCPNDSGDQECLSDGIRPEGFCIDVCEFDDACPSGFACAEGACTRQDCTPEDCDGIDNDCDGTVDENSDGTGPLSQWCLTGGDPSVAPLPPCQRGTQVCSAGAWSECRDEIPPVDEVGILACNSRDDDCDGCVDGTFNEVGMCVVTPPNGFDVLYLIDISGSMSSSLNSVKMATATFSSLYAGNPEFRFGIVVVSGRGTLDGRAFVIQDFTDFTTFNATLGTMTANGGGSEPTWDAIYEAATDEIVHGADTTGDGIYNALYPETTGLSWRDGSIRIMILFTDEEAQTTRESRGLGRVNEFVMCRALTHGELLVTFGEAPNRSAFDDCGLWYPLSSDPTVMVGHLEGIIADPCI